MLQGSGSRAIGGAGVTEGPQLLQVSGLEAGYGNGRLAIEQCTFDVAPGELVAVLGPNGGGKTTLFRALLGELPLIRGVIERRAPIAYVPQTERARLDYPVSALDVALMGTYSSLPWHGRVGPSQRQTALEALAQVGLEPEAATAFGDLSGGQRQRVLIARALAQAAEIMLLDEPLSGVDRPSARRVLDVLRQLRDQGRGVLVATHDISQARDFDRVLCVNGAQVAFGPPQQTLSRATLERTYGSELVMLDGEPAVVVDHHSH
jgi:manganese/iron transport system ATP-binding protein/manganese/zinc/iron transport system ATP- binding protein